MLSLISSVLRRPVAVALASVIVVCTAERIVTSILIYPSNIVGNNGYSVQLNAWDQNRKDVTLTWSSADTNIVRIDREGIASFVGVGKTIVIGTMGGIADTIAIRVVDQ